MTIRIPIAVSARHPHLSQATIDEVFGVGHQLRPRTWLSQTGQFAAQETVTSPIVVAIFFCAASSTSIAQNTDESTRPSISASEFVKQAVWRKSRWANLALRRRQWAGQGVRQANGDRLHLT